MITEVHVKNFRAIGNETVLLDPLTILVGQNGAGKSSFVDAIRFVRDAVAYGADTAVLRRGGMAALRRWAPRRPYDVEIALKFSWLNFHGRYGFTLATGGEEDFKIKSEFCEIGKKADTVDFRFEREGSKIMNAPKHWFRGRNFDKASLALSAAGVIAPEFSRLRRLLRYMEFSTIFPNTLRDPQKPNPAVFLEDHGENFATILRNLLKQARSKDALRDVLDRVVTGIKDIRVSPVGGFLVTELQHSLGEKKAWFDLSQESDGTLRLLGILVALYYNRFRIPRGMSFLAIEEPELTLHPGALAVISDELVQASARSQLLITTQSPDLITRFEARLLRVVERVEGVTHIGPVDERQKEAVEKSLFSSGDLLRIEGLRRHVSER